MVTISWFWLVALAIGAILSAICLAIYFGINAIMFLDWLKDSREREGRQKIDYWEAIGILLFGLPILIHCLLDIDRG